MNALKPAKPGPSKPSLRRAASPAEKEERKVFLREVRKLLSAYPRHEEDLGWVIETPYGPVEVGNPETPSGPSTLYFIPIRFTGTQEQFMAFWNQNGRFEKCSPNGKWNILDPNPRKALWLLRYRLAFTKPNIPLPPRITVINLKSQREPTKRKTTRRAATAKSHLLPNDLK